MRQNHAYRRQYKCFSIYPPSVLIDTTGMSNISFTLDEGADQPYGEGKNWLNELGTPADNQRIKTYTTAEGVTFTVNKGLVTAQLDNTKLLDLEKVLASYATVTAPDGATEYRMAGNGTSTEPGAADDAGAKGEVTSMKEWLDRMHIGRRIEVHILYLGSSIGKLPLKNAAVYAGDGISDIIGHIAYLLLLERIGRNAYRDPFCLLHK